MVPKITTYINVLRPLQAYKASIVWLPALFHGQGSLGSQARVLLLVSLAWWFTSCIVYVLNDLVDAPRDREREDRRHRPIASGEISTAQALTLVAVLLLLVGALLRGLPLRISLLLGVYAGLNLIYSIGIKQVLGARQTVIALGFWLRLQSGAAPVVPIPLTPWASLFTLGLAYYLNCLKGLAAFDQDHHRGHRFASGMGAGLAGSLTLASLVAICLKRGVEGTMHFPELPPLFCLLGMHRVASSSFRKDLDREQAKRFFADPVVLAAMLAFFLLFVVI